MGGKCHTQDKAVLMTSITSDIVTKFITITFIGEVSNYCSLQCVVGSQGQPVSLQLSHTK